MKSKVDTPESMRRSGPADLWAGPSPIWEVIIDDMVRRLRASILRRVQRAQRRGSGTHPGGEFLQAQVIPSQALRSRYQFNGWPYFSNRLVASGLGPRKPRGVILERRRRLFDRQGLPAGS
jgi:hypothetical protein